MKNILITGAGERSFVGRNLREALTGCYNIFAPAHSELELLDFDALENYVRQNRIDAIVHAAIHVPMFNGAEKEFFNDMQMFMNIEKISHSVEKVIYFGSGAEFDKRFDIRRVSEDDIGKTIPASEYGLAKYTMNAIAARSDNIYNLRLFGIFGKYELWQIKFLSNLCCKALLDLPLTVRRECYFDFLYIDDLAPAVCAVLEAKPLHHDYNVCMGTEYRLTELAAMVLKVSGKQLPVTLLSDERNFDYSADNSRLLSEFPSLSVTPMEQALTALYGYYSERKNEINYELLRESK